jgi:hypothetical protein
VNSLTGCNTIKPGDIDISPETLDLVWDTLTGSAGRFAADTAGLPFLAASGELTLNRTPFARRVMGEKSEYSDTSIYKENIDRIFTLAEEIKEYPENKELRKEKAYQLVGFAKNTESMITKLNKAMKNAKTDEQKKRLKAQINKLRMNFNKKYNSTVN